MALKASHEKRKGSKKEERFNNVARIASLMNKKIKRQTVLRAD